MVKAIFKWMTFLSPVVLVAGIGALIYAFASDSYYDPNAVVTDSEGFTSHGAYVTNSGWAWAGGILLTIGMLALFVGIFGWVFSALWSPAAKALKEVSSSLDSSPSGVATAPAPGVATPGWSSSPAPPGPT